MSSTANPPAVVAPPSRALGSGTTNPNGETYAHAQGRWPEGLLLFDPASNQLIEVPKATVPVVLEEANKMEAWCRELHEARQALLSAEEARDKLNAQRFPSLSEAAPLSAQIEAAERRYNAAYQQIKTELGDQGYLTGATNGRELMELIPIAKRETVGQPARAWGRKATYVRGDKMKDHWRTYKLGPGDKGQNISFIKDGQIDTKTLKEQFTKIEPKLKHDWGVAAGHIWPQLQGWAESMRSETRLVGKDAKDVKPDESQLSVDLKTDAHLFRYFLGFGAEGTWAPREGKISGKVNGKAELQIARAEAVLECLYPGPDGWAWSLRGVKSGRTYHIGAMRLQATLKLSAGAGASVSAELAVEVDYRSMVSGAKGPPIKGAKRRAHPEGEPRGVKLDDIGNVSAGAEAFAGLKAGGELMGGLQFRNPEKGDRFDYIAAVGPKVEGQLGAGAAASLMITYERGKFRVRAKAALCIGLGAKGELALEVGAARLGSFLHYLFHALLNANFEMLVVVHQRAYEEAVKLQVLIVDGVRDAYLTLENDWDEFERRMEREDRRVALMERVLSNPLELRTCTPEAHGILLHQLTRHGGLTKAIPANTGLHLELLYRRKQAVLQVCRWAQTKRQFENIVQHISPTGAKGGFKGNLDGLLRFMEVGPGDSQLDDQLLSIYGRLPDRPASGYAVALNHTSEFFAQAKVGPSPTYMAMLGNGLPLPSNFA